MANPTDTSIPGIPVTSVEGLINKAYAQTAPIAKPITQLDITALQSGVIANDPDAINKTLDSLKADATANVAQLGGPVDKTSAMADKVFGGMHAGKDGNGNLELTFQLKDPLEAQSMAGGMSVDMPGVVADADGKVHIPRSALISADGKQLDPAKLATFRKYLPELLNDELHAAIPGAAIDLKAASQPAAAAPAPIVPGSSAIDALSSPNAAIMSPILGALTTGVLSDDPDAINKALHETVTSTITSAKGFEKLAPRLQEQLKGDAAAVLSNIQADKGADGHLELTFKTKDAAEAQTLAAKMSADIQGVTADADGKVHIPRSAIVDAEGKQFDTDKLQKLQKYMPELLNDTAYDALSTPETVAKTDAITEAQFKKAADDLRTLRNADGSIDPANRDKAVTDTKTIEKYLNEQLENETDPAKRKDLRDKQNENEAVQDELFRQKFVSPDKALPKDQDPLVALITGLLKMFGIDLAGLGAPAAAAAPETTAVTPAPATPAADPAKAVDAAAPAAAPADDKDPLAAAQTPGVKAALKDLDAKITAYNNISQDFAGKADEKTKFAESAGITKISDDDREKILAVAATKTADEIKTVADKFATDTDKLSAAGIHLQEDMGVASDKKNLHPISAGYIKGDIANDKSKIAGLVKDIASLPKFAVAKADTDHKIPTATGTGAAVEKPVVTPPGGKMG